ncbi:MAG: hypothetical protein IIW08_07900 [Clostridia bacterium]|nr:hypothetical protein [Clostridia bacterium]MBQ5771082.1 hypothetical protein [Clostridia bacterium]
MDQNAKLTKVMCETARMGAEAVSMLLNKTDDEGMRQTMLSQKAMYEKFDREGEQILHKAGQRVKKQGPLARAGTWMGIQMDTMMDNTSSHLADMLIQGSTMGVIEITRAKSENPEANGEAVRLADAYLEEENNNIEKLKKYL